MSKFNCKTYNKIAKKGLEILESVDISINEDRNVDLLLLRSQNMHDYDFDSTLLAVGRAGAGTNNIPVEKCTKNGIVVFNAPGANANAVKELVISGMLLASRNIYFGLTYVNSLKNTDKDIHEEVERNKSKFKGAELRGKKLGIIGLGAIGVLVANDAAALGMEVLGFDPYISVDRAWGLSTSVKPASNLKNLLSNVDFLTFHMPLNDTTRDFFDFEKMSSLKKGCTVLNFARPEIIVESDLCKALDEKIINKFVTDFPNNTLLERDNVIGLPHLGASTQEAEDNCSIMVSRQLIEYVHRGNIMNSVNFPNCVLEPSSGHRIAIFNENKPNMVGQITAKIADKGLNIIEMMNKSRGEIAYTLVDTIKEPSDDLIDNIKNIDGVLFVRKIY
ncbi:3-phosphoglycerate dehydrogenase [Candidatus Marinamargulisbacteria bacterium SCGC AG-343-D04]|nr:3-phosphoglycerate dehydrogenase [Candidatus Marinamargulisbacteria bacterium SCGC AG-343-D04]